MSKILESVKIVSGGLPENFERHLANVGRLSVFPMPSGMQLKEFDKLANSLMRMQEGELGEAITFSAMSSGEGASFVSYNVARQIADLFDRKVAWVDANFQSPVRRAASEDLDFRTLLKDPGRIEELDVAENFVVIPHGHRPVKSTGLLTSDAYLEFLGRCQQRFSFTVIDAPPILESVDVGHLAQPTLGLVLVIESRRLDKEVIRHGIETLRGANVKILGSILNRRVFDIPEFIYRKL